MADHALPSQESSVTPEPRDQPVTAYERQIELEMEMRSIGTQRFSKMIADAKGGRRETETPYGSALMEEAVLPTAEKIRGFLKENESPGRGAVHLAVPYLFVIDNPELAAYQTSKAILDGISTTKDPLSLAFRIGSSLEDEVRLREFEDKNKAYLRTLLRSLNKRSKHAGYRKRVLVFSMNKAGIHWAGWPKEDKIHLGMKLIELFIEATGFITLEQDFVKAKDTPYRVVPSPSVLEWIIKKNASGSVMQPELLPMIIPPKDWASSWGGGYISKALPRLALVKTFDHPYLEDLSAVEIPKVFTAINGLQKTAWQINAEVLMVFRELWNTGMEIGDTPAKALEENPPKPLDIDTNDESKKAWKRSVNEVKTRNIQRTSKIIQTAKILSIAEKFVEEPTIYFPYQMDFRGRLYAVPMFLNPQGPDHAKALLRFSEGKPLETQDAADWLAIHGANTFGADKVSYEDRIEWVRENEENIIKSAENPLDHLWWTTAESPWQFLAFCFEWYGYTIHGLDWASKIPIALDGSCNGLQHFSAMLKDEVGGAAVNLVPLDQPADIYQTVADRVLEELKDDMSPMALAWKKLGITRKWTKRCVMTLPYGATEFAFKSFIQDLLKETGKGSVFGDQLKNFGAAAFLAKKIHSGISKTVVKAMEAMKWLQDISKKASDTRLPIQWITPSGLPVIQKYLTYDNKKIDIKMSGKVIQLNMSKDSGEINKRRQANAVSPNFVHSLDASALMETVGAALEDNITSFAMIHDSYGTHARDTSTLAQILRQSFVGLYKEKNVLGDFRQCVALCCDIPLKELPESPIMGDLEIEGVLGSKYFFA